MSKFNLELRRGKTEHDEERNNVVVHVFPEEPSEENEDFSLSRILWPVRFSLMCFGMIWKTPNGRTTTRCGYYHSFHCIVTLSIIWINALHYLLAYESGEGLGEHLLIKLLCHILALQWASCITAFIYCHNKHLPFFLRQWESYKLRYGGFSLNLMKKLTFRRILGVDISIFVFLLCFSVGTMVLPRGKGYEDTKHLLMPFLWYTPKSIEKFMEFLYVTVQFYTSMAWAQSAVILVGLCYLLSNEFQVLWNEYAQSIAKNTENQVNKYGLKRSKSEGAEDRSTDHKRRFNNFAVEHYRLQHQELALLVGRLDKVMHTYLLLLYFSSVPIIVLLVFSLGTTYSNVERDIIIMFRGFLGILFFIVVITSVTYAGTSLAGSARLGKAKIQTIDLSSCTLEETMSVQVLLLKFANDHTGLTLGKFINIDKGLFLTLFTTIITYLVITLKVSMAFDGSHGNQQNTTVSLDPNH